MLTRNMVASMPAKKKSTRRNPVANAPILRKGGVHAKSRKAERKVGKQKLKDELAD
jgi:hypothetical protein